MEEPIHEEREGYSLDMKLSKEGVVVLTPKIAHGTPKEEENKILASLINQFMPRFVSPHFVSWYYTPMALEFSDHLTPLVTVYDCMDELSLFAGSHPELIVRERELLEKANVVFTGGNSLYRAKRELHANVHSMPSSIDGKHFGKARTRDGEPSDQAGIPGPRIGFFGVVDERMDLELLREVATRRPDYHFVIIGPVVKIDPNSLPTLPNIHYLGQKCYQELPNYLGGWDVAMLPLALNDATRFISPTKTPEYLAGGVPVVSTPITDVVDPYGTRKLVNIARTADEFVQGIEGALRQGQDSGWLRRVDSFLSTMSWDKTWAKMNHHIVASGRELDLPSSAQLGDH